MKTISSLDITTEEERNEGETPVQKRPFIGRYAINKTTWYVNYQWNRDARLERKYTPNWIKLKTVSNHKTYLSGLA